MKKLAILAVAVLVCLPGLAAAAFVSYTTTTPIAGTTLTDWTNTLAFQKFNPTLGTLTQVELYLSSNMDTVISVTNQSPTSSSNGTAQTRVLLGVRDPLSLIFQTIDNTFPPGFGFMFNLTTYPGPGNSASSPLYTSNATKDSFYTDSTLLNEFIGTDNILLNALTATFTTLSYSGGVLESSQVTHAGLTGTVTYSYTAVPAPATLLLLGSGLVGLLALRRRQKVSKN